MADGIRILSENLSGETVHIIFTADTGSTITDFGVVTIPADLITDYFYGTYSISAQTYDAIYTHVIGQPQNLLIDDLGNNIITDNGDFLVMSTGPVTPTPTTTPQSTVTPTVTPSITVSVTPSVTLTMTPTPTGTPTPTPSSTPSTPILTNLVVNLDAGNSSSYSGTGTVWIDLQGNNNGTLVNGPTYNPNNQGSIVTDGINDYILIGRVPGTGTANQSFTYELWVKPLDNDGNIMSMSSQNPQTDWNMPPISAVSGRFNAKIWQNNILSSNNTFTIGQWYQVALVWDYPNSTQYLYVNGVLNDSQGTIIYDSSNIDNFIFLGQENPGEGNTGMFGGEYGIVRLYNTALSGPQILSNYNATSSRY